jgi:hypothetical protein
MKEFTVTGSILTQRRLVSDLILNKVKVNIQVPTYKKGHNFAKNNFKIICPLEMVFFYDNKHVCQV